MELNTLYTEIETEEGYGYNISENFNQFLNIIKTNLGKCRYKKVVEEISSVMSLKAGLFNQLKNYWRLTEFKLEAILKIITKKLNKYTQKSKKSYPLKALDSCFKDATDTLEEWSNSLITYDGNEEQVNSYIYFTLSDMYLNILHLKNQNRYFELTSILSQAERLVKSIINDCTIPKVLNLCQKVFLLISSLMIADSSFEHAKVYQYYAMQLVIKEMFYRSNADDKLSSIEHAGSAEQLGIKNLAVNFCLAFYHRGVCEENMGNLYKTFECFRQCNWAAKKFLRIKAPEFVQYLHYLEDKVRKYKDLQDMLNKEKIQREQLKKKNKDAIKHLRSELIDAKYEKIRGDVEKVIDQIPENALDQNNNTSSSPSKYIMSTVDLLDKLLSKDFRDVVRDANDIKLFEMDKEFHEKFKKRIGHLRLTKLFNERAKELFGTNKYPTLTELYSLVRLKDEKRRASQETTTYCGDIPSPGGMNKKNFLQIAIDRIKARSKSVLSSDSVKTGVTAEFTRGHHRVRSAIDSNWENSPVKSSARLSVRSDSVRLILLEKLRPKDDNEGKVRKIQHDDYVFSKKFKNKINYLYSIEKKELAFQKQLLNLKRCEKMPETVQDESDIHNEVNQFFQNTIKTKIVNHIDPNDGMKENLANVKKAQKYRKLEREAITSLNTKKFEEYSSFIKKKESTVSLSDEFNPNASFTPATEKLPVREIDKMKNNIMGDINRRLGYIEERKKKCLKVLHPITYKDKSPLMRKSVTKYEKPSKVMDEFVKFTTPSQHRISQFNYSFIKK
jgi:hypothetical protein